MDYVHAMILLNPIPFQLIKVTRTASTLLVCALFVFGCSNSGNSQSPSESELADTDATNPIADDATDSTINNGVDSTANNTDVVSTVDQDTVTPVPITSEPTTAESITSEPVTPEPVTSEPVTPEPAALISTRVEFDITVPAYQSNALQVRLFWGDKDILARFVVDESWAVSDDFPTDTENELVLRFNDDNGSITLGSFEQAFRTGTSASESFQITADQFDTDRWDDDGDGVSNLDELLVGTNPLIDKTFDSTEATVAGIARILNENPAFTLITEVRNLALISVALTDREPGEPVRLIGSAGNEFRRTVVTCNNGGSYIHDFFTGPVGGSTNLDISGCNIDGIVFNGSAFLNLTFAGSVSVTYTDFTATELSGKQSSVSSGVISRFRTQGRDFARVTNRDIDFSIVEPGQELNVTALNQSEEDDLDLASRTSLSTSFTVSAPWTAGETVEVSTPVILEGAGISSRNYTVSQMELVSDQGGLVIDMDTGDTDTYLVTSTNGDSVTSDIFPWTDATSFGCVTHPVSPEILELCER